MFLTDTEQIHLDAAEKKLRNMNPSDVSSALKKVREERKLIAKGILDLNMKLKQEDALRDQRENKVGIK